MSDPDSYREIVRRAKTPLLFLLTPCGYVALPIVLKTVGFGYSLTLITVWLALLLPACLAIAIRGASDKPSRPVRHPGPLIVCASVLLVVALLLGLYSASRSGLDDLVRYFWLVPFALGSLFASMAIAIARSPHSPWHTGPGVAEVFRPGWFLRAATMVVGLLVGVPVALAGVVVLIEGNGSRAVGAIAGLVGTGLFAAGVRAVLIQRRVAAQQPDR